MRGKERERDTRTLRPGGRIGACCLLEAAMAASPTRTTWSAIASGRMIGGGRHSSQGCGHVCLHATRPSLLACNSSEARRWLWLLGDDAEDIPQAVVALVAGVFEDSCVHAPHRKRDFDSDPSNVDGSTIVAEDRDDGRRAAREPARSPSCFATCQSRRNCRSVH